MIRCFFFFKQKTAYEMRISDWSPDVCSSDLRAFGPRRRCGHTSGFPPSRSTMNTNAELLKELRIDRKAAPPPSRRGLWIALAVVAVLLIVAGDRKSTRLNSSH